MFVFCSDLSLEDDIERLRSLSLEPSSSEFLFRPTRRSFSFPSFDPFFGEIGSLFVETLSTIVLATSLKVGGFATFSRTTTSLVGEKPRRPEFRFSVNRDSNLGRSNSHLRRNFSRPISTENNYNKHFLKVINYYCLFNKINSKLMMSLKAF